MPSQPIPSNSPQKNRKISNFPVAEISDWNLATIMKYINQCRSPFHLPSPPPKKNEINKYQSFNRLQRAEIDQTKRKSMEKLAEWRSLAGLGLAYDNWAFNTREALGGDDAKKRRHKCIGDIRETQRLKPPRGTIECLPWSWRPAGTEDPRRPGQPHRDIRSGMKSSTPGRSPIHQSLIININININQ